MGLPTTYGGLPNALAAPRSLQWIGVRFPCIQYSSIGSGVYVHAIRRHQPSLNALAPSQKFRAAYVGSSMAVERRLIEQNENPKILAALRSEQAVVFVARVNWRRLEGVERYLANALMPRAGDCHPNVEPVAVNLPPGDWSITLTDLVLENGR